MMIKTTPVYHWYFGENGLGSGALCRLADVVNLGPESLEAIVRRLESNRIEDVYGKNP